METKKFNYEAPEAVVFGVETQNCFASGVNPAGLRSLTDRDDVDWDEE